MPGAHAVNWRDVGVEPLMVAQALRQAADVVRDLGWYQGRWRDPDTGAVDATQALGDAVGLDLVVAATSETRMATGATALLGAALSAVLTDAEAPVLAVWNDREGRTAHEVVTLLERVATRCEDMA